jgi:hypothetical protein
MKKLLVLILFLFAGTISIADSNYKTISLPKGVSIDLPINWQVISNNERITLDAYVETLFDPLDSELPFAANYYNDNDEIDALMNIRYYPREVVTQENVINMFTPDVLREMDDVLYKSSTLAMKKISGKMLSWNGTKKKLIKDTVALVTDYRRYEGLSKSNARVRLVRVLNGNKSFTLTVSYVDNKKSSFMLKEITNRIIESLSLSN